MKFSIVWILATAFLFSCNNDNNAASDENNEAAQQIGDTMAAMDETGGSNGEIAFQESDQRIFERLSPKDVQLPFWKRFISNEAYAVSCLNASTFGACDDNVIIHTFDDCTLLLARFDGTVSLTWGQTSNDCQLQVEGDTITREPEYTVTGLRGAELSVSKTGSVGQRLEWTDGDGNDKVFKFTNDGIRRKFTTPAGATLLDFTTKTDEAITITGTKRSNRVVNGGKLKVTNNKTDISCQYTPVDVSWSLTCNCATSGAWTATCSDGTEASLDITGCGTAELTIDNGTPKDIEFDRCIGI